MTPDQGVAVKIERRAQVSIMTDHTWADAPPEEPTKAMLERAQRIAEATGCLLTYNQIHDIWQGMYDEWLAANWPSPAGRDPK